MNKTELVKKVMEEAEVTKAQAEKAVASVLGGG